VTAGSIAGSIAERRGQGTWPAPAGGLPGRARGGGD